MYVFSPLRIGDAHQQHVLGHPAFAEAHEAGQTQGQALLAQQGVAAVARAEAPDGVIERKMADAALFGLEIAQGVQAASEIFLVLGQLVPGGRAHARHDAHVDGHVDRIGDLDADAGQRRTDGPHDERQHVHGSALHRSGEVGAQLGVGLPRFFPVVGRPGQDLVGRADERRFFGAGDVMNLAAVEVAAGQLVLVEPDERSFSHRPLKELLFLLRAAVQYAQAIRPAHLGHFADPPAHLRAGNSAQEVLSVRAHVLGVEFNHGHPVVSGQRSVASGQRSVASGQGTATIAGSTSSIY